MAAVQRNLLHRPLGHHLADRDRRGLDERRRAGDRDVFGERADAELRLDDRSLRDAEIRMSPSDPEAVDVRDDGVAAGRQRRGDVLAGGVGDGRPLDTGGGHCEW